MIHVLDEANGATQNSKKRVKRVQVETQILVLLIRVGKRPFL